MSAIKSFFKNIIPLPLRDFLRKNEGVIFDFITNTGRKICSTKYQGYTVFYNRGNELIRRLRREKIFEPELFGQITKDLKSVPSPRFVDVGANIGLIALSVMRDVPGVHIDAFEPGPLQRGFLERAIRENGLIGRVSVHAEALGDMSGVKKFAVHNPRDAAKDGFIETGRGAAGETILVPVMTLSEWWIKNGRPKIGVVKIDTEGAELLVLRGAREFIVEVNPIVYLEIEERNLRVYPYTAADIVNFFDEIGYEITTLSGKQVSSDSIKQALPHFDTYRATPYTYKK